MKYLLAMLGFVLLADQGDAPEQASFASMFHNSQAVQQDQARAHMAYTFPVRRGNERGEASDAPIAVRPQISKAQTYLNGDDLCQREDLAAALCKWRKLAEQGVAEAQYNLGNMYYNGLGVSLHLVRAYMWLSLAITHGAGAKATANRELFAEQMTPAQIFEAEQLARAWLDQHHR
jgi:TPR repeat protein